MFLSTTAYAQAPAPALTQSAAQALSASSRRAAPRHETAAQTPAARTRSAATARVDVDSPDRDEGPSAFRFFIEGGLAPNYRVNFIAPNDVAADEVEAACAASDVAEAEGIAVEDVSGVTMGCNFAEDQQFDAMRGTAGFSYGGLTLMGALTKSMESRFNYLDVGLGARLETGWDSIFSVQFEFAYVKRMGDLAADGGRAGLGIILRPFDWFALYGSGTVDVTAVPAEMFDSGSALFSYSTALMGGARFELGT